MGCNAISTGRGVRMAWNYPERPDTDYPDYDPLYGEDPDDYSDEYWEDLINTYITEGDN